MGHRRLASPTWKDQKKKWTSDFSLLNNVACTLYSPREGESELSFFYLEPARLFLFSFFLSSPFVVRSNLKADPQQDPQEEEEQGKTLSKTVILTVKTGPWMSLNATLFIYCCWHSCKLLLAKAFCSDLESQKFSKLLKSSSPSFCGLC